MRKTFQKLMAEYGVIAAIVYFTIFFGTLFAAWTAIQRGVNLAAVAARSACRQTASSASRCVDGRIHFYEAPTAGAYRPHGHSHPVACASVRADPRAKQSS